VGKNKNFRINSEKTKTPVVLILGVSTITLGFNTSFYDPFNSAKLIIIFILGNWLLGHLVSDYKYMRIKSEKNYMSLMLFIFLFNIFLLYSTISTKPQIIGFLGDTQRRNGFIGYFCLCIILVYSTKVINNSNVISVYKAGIFTAFIMSFYGLIQITGNDFVRWNNPYNAMISTLGNPNFASAMLAIFTTLSLSSLLLKNLPVIYKCIAILTSLMSSIAIIRSESRQGLIALFFSIIFYVAIFSYIKNKKLGSIVIFLSFFIFIFAVLGMLQKGPLQTLLYKNSVSVRGYYWRAGLEMFKHSPFKGVGVDRYGSFFKEFREVGYPLKYGYDITSSNAHNTFIQLFATSGIFVGSLYILIVLSIFIIGIRFIKDNNFEDKKIMLGLISAWIAFQAQSLISIDNLGISVWGWLLGGSIVGLSLKRNLNGNVLSENKISNTKKVVKINMFQPVLSGFFLIPAIMISIQIYRSETNLYHLKSYSANISTQSDQMINYYANTIIESSMVDPFYKYLAAISFFDIGQTDKAYKITKTLYSEDGNNLEFLKGLIALENYKQNYTAVLKARIEMTKLDPWNAENYLQLLIIYKNQGDLEKAKQMKNIILSFAPNSDARKKAQEILG